MVNKFETICITCDRYAIAKEIALYEQFFFWHIFSDVFRFKTERVVILSTFIRWEPEVQSFCVKQNG